MDRTERQPPEAQAPLRRRMLRVLLSVLVAYAALVATHEGEFWPFSIFPMFSQAGQPWSRALVRDVTDAGGLVSWEPVSVEELPGEAFAVGAYGVNRLDLSNFLSKTEVWDAERVEGLRAVLRPGLADRRLLVLRAVGELDDERGVRVELYPYLVLDADTAVLSPALAR